jgi:hypothetical protein
MKKHIYLLNRDLIENIIEEDLLTLGLIYFLNMLINGLMVKKYLYPNHLKKQQKK